MENADLYYQILVIVFGLIAAYFGAGVIKAKRIAGETSVVLKEVAELLDQIGVALEDNQLTKEEISLIVIQSQETLTSAKTLIDDLKSVAGFITSLIKK